MSVEQKVKVWAPATSCKVPDNIVSSVFSSQKMFVPSYEKEKRPCMEQLLTNEYQRIWWQEKETWDRVNSKKTTTNRILQRMVIRKKPPGATKTEKAKKPKKLKDKKGMKSTKTNANTKQTKESEEKTDKPEKTIETDKTAA